MFEEAAITICVNQSSEERSVYEAVRGVWKLKLKRASKINVILAELGGLFIDVFEAEEWLPAHPDHFLWLDVEIPNRFGFKGKKANADLVEHYSYKRSPRRKKGESNPIRYFDVPNRL